MRRLSDELCYPLLALLMALSLVFYATPASANETDEDLPLTRIPVSLQPDLFTGILAGSLPIEVPIGRNGMQPNLQLAYLSGGGNGWIGMGWKLEVGAIERQTRQGVLYNPTTADEQAGKVYTFRLDGMSSDLVQDAGNPLLYHAKVESLFLRFKKLSSDGMAGWEVTDKKGTKYTFGTTARIASPDGSLIFKWCLERIEDRDGNYMTFSYVGDQGQGYLAQIQYTGNGAAAPTNSVKFYLEDRADALDLYTSHFKIKTAKRLKTIEVKANGGLVRAYKLNYVISVDTTHSLLSTVQQYGKDATINPVTGEITGGSVLPAITMTYLTDQLSFTDGSLWLGGWCNGGTIHSLADFNNDGKHDLWCKETNGAMSMAFSNGTGQFTNQGSYFHHSIPQPPADFDGDGRSDLLSIGSEIYCPPDLPFPICYPLSNFGVNLAPSFELFSWLDLAGEYQVLATKDFNGDGKQDLIIQGTDPSGGSVRYVLRSSGSGFQWPAMYDLTGGCAGGTYGVGDINGDGMGDIWCNVPNNSTHTLLSTGNSFSTGPSLGNWCGSGIVGSSDFNGDGKEDFYCHPSDGTTKVALFTGTALLDTGTWLTGWCASGQFGSADFNGDGKQDLYCHPTDGTTQVALSTGSAFSNSGTWLSNWCSTGTFGVGDFTGDVRRDLYCHQNGQVSVARSGSGTLGRPDVLTAVSNGIGANETIVYNLTPQTVKSLTTIDGNGNTSMRSYAYEGIAYYSPERDFRGFNKTTVTSPAGPSGEQAITETWFHQGNDVAVDVNNPNVPNGYVKGKPYRSKVSKVGSPNMPLTETTTTYLADADGVAPWFTPPTIITTTIYDPAGAVAKVSQMETVSYDAYGNPTLVYHRGDATNNNALISDDKTVAMTFGNYDATNWLMAFPSVEAAYAGLGTGGTKLAETKYFYDGVGSCTTPTGTLTPTKGHVTKVERWLNVGTNPISGMEYNSSGSLTCLRDALGHTSQVVYDPTSTFPLTSTNALGHVTTTTYYGVNGVSMNTGLYGQVKTVTDPNSQVVTTTYDPLGRTLTTTSPASPTNLTTTVTYPTLAQFGQIGTQNIQLTTSGGNLGVNLVSKSYFDGLGRTIKTENPGPADGGGSLKVLVTESQYEARGLVKQTSLPYIQGSESVTGRWRLLTYDALGRPIDIQQPDTTHQKFCYHGWTTTTIDPKQHKKVATQNAYEQVSVVQEYLGQVTAADCSGGTLATTNPTTYTYNQMGNLLSVTDAKGNVTSMTYDTLGRKLTMHDPDMGNWSYIYDAVGNLTKQTDAKGQILWFRYDALNRRSQKDFTTQKAQGSGDVVYTYDGTTFNRKGRLKKMQDATGNVTLEYDAMGNVSKSTRVLDAVTYVTSSTYDGLSRLRTLTYPTNPTNPTKTITYTYDGPQLKQVTEGATAYVTYAGWNALGLPGTATFGNGAVTTMTYANTSNPICTQQTFRLCTLKTQKGAKPLYQDLRYDYEANGNVWNIYDQTVPNNAGDQHLSYDDLDRLTLANGPFGVSGANASFTYTYDEIGNLTLNSQLSANPYTYPASGVSSVRPHAVTTAGAHTYTYDNNGNMLTGAGRTLTWNLENKPLTVVKGATTTTLVYDGENRRVKKIVGSTMTRYISQFYECDNTNCSRYIWAGNTRIATVAASGTIHYWHGDHLGSSSVITNSTGAKVQAVTYYPYGNTRTNQSFTTPAVDVPYKYTGQELDTSTALYDYQARQYDPALGRFLSADTIIPAPSNPQDFNRYSYVRNNPFNYTDPTGQNSVSDWKATRGGGFFSAWDCCSWEWFDNLIALVLQLGPGGTPFWNSAFAEGANRISGPAFHAPGLPLAADSIMGHPVFITDTRPGINIISGRDLLDAGWLLNVDRIQGGLDAAGFIPALSTPAGLANAAISALQGHYGEAAKSTFTAIPMIGTIGKLGQVANKLNPFRLLPTHGLTKPTKSMEKLKEDIRVNGIRETIKVYERGGQTYILDGHHRVRAAKELGLEEVPIERVELPYKGYRSINDLLGE